MYRKANVQKCQCTNSPVETRREWPVMYIPAHFRMNEDDKFKKLIEANSFGILVSVADGRPMGTHIPFLYDTENRSLFGHVARANPQWENLQDQSAMVIFSGPHAYISPSWYEVPASVPTWNYVAAHVYGTCHLIDDEEELRKYLTEMIRFFEPDSDLPAQNEQSFFTNMMKAIVGFRIDITEIQATAKLSQNKSTDVQKRVIANLRSTTDPYAHSIALLMEENLRTE